MAPGSLPGRGEEEEEEVEEEEEEEGGEGEGEGTPLSPLPSPPGVSPTRARLMVAVFCFVNLLNYMDRFSVASVLPDVQSFFGIGDSSSGLLQTVFISSYMVLAPLFGFLGDRQSRKRLLVLSITLWSGVTLGSSFVPPQHFWALLLSRALVGVGEAAHSTLTPTLIADIYSGAARSRALGGFYIATPLGSGLGYILGAKVKDLGIDWRWALRVTPPLGVVAIFLLVAVVVDPPRGGLESPPGAPPPPRTSWATDLRLLATNPSLVLSTLGFTAVAFVTGALALWAPAFLERMREGGDRGQESLIFGVLTCASGVLGVWVGTELSRRLRTRHPRAEPLICGGGLLGAAPCLLLALCTPRNSPATAYVFIFLGETLLSLNWAVVADILLAVVVPTRRATAEALQIVASHLLGDAGSPYLVGLLSDHFRSRWGGGGALELALLLCPFAAALGGGAFLGTAHCYPRDRRRAWREARGLPPDPPLLDPPRDVTAAPDDVITADQDGDGGDGGGRGGSPRKGFGVIFGGS